MIIFPVSFASKPPFRVMSTLGWGACRLIAIDLLITRSEVVVTTCTSPDVVRRSRVCFVLFKCVVP